MTIHFFCALPCEAEPLIQHYDLKQEKQHQLFRLFVSEKHEISLTITGIGKNNAAAAVSYHHASLSTRASDIWLNVGVAGHSDLEIGEACLTNKITDVATGHCWYPQILIDVPCPSLSLQTLDKASDDYQHTLFDMEASGFYSIAIRLGTAELIHCFKVVSDNHVKNTQTVTAADVTQHIARHLVMIDDIIKALTPIATELRGATALPPAYELVTTQWHFTRTQQLQLARLLNQWQCRLPDSDVMKHLDKQQSAEAVLSTLRQTLATTPFTISSAKAMCT